MNVMCADSGPGAWALEFDPSLQGSDDHSNGIDDLSQVGENDQAEIGHKRDPDRVRRDEYLRLAITIPHRDSRVEEISVFQHYPLNGQSQPDTGVRVAQPDRDGAVQSGEVGVPVTVLIAVGQCPERGEWIAKALPDLPCRFAGGMV